jgi:iron(III) transport system permease protein
LLLVVFGVCPLLLVLWRSFLVEGDLSLGNYARVFGRPANWRALVTTLQVAGLTTLFSLLMAFPLAWLVSRTDVPARTHLRLLFTIPYMIPPYLGAIAWSQLLNPDVGYVNRALKGLLDLAESPFDIYTFTGLLWVMVLFEMPLALLTLAAGLEKMDPTLEESARMAGANRWRVLTRITLPLLTPSLISAGSLVFAAAIAAFGVPAIIGSPGRIHVLTTRITSHLYQGGVSGLREATALSSVLMAISLTVFLLATWAVGRRRFTVVGGKSLRPPVIPLGRWRWPVLGLAVAFILLTSVLPLASICLTSLLRSRGATISWENLTLAKYVYVLTSYPDGWLAFKNSLLLGATTATGGVLIGFVVAYLRVRLRRRAGRWADLFTTVAYATPGSVIAVGLILAFSGTYGVSLYGTIAILGVAYSIKHLAFGVRTAAASLEQLDVVLEEAARTSGAGWLGSLRHVVLPLVRSGLMAGWLLIFMPAFYELTMSILLFSAGTMTVGVALYQLESYSDPQAASVLAVLILAVVLVGNILLRRVTGGQVGL